MGLQNHIRPAWVSKSLLSFTCKILGLCGELDRFVNLCSSVLIVWSVYNLLKILHSPMRRKNTLQLMWNKFIPGLPYRWSTTRTSIEAFPWIYTSLLGLYKCNTFCQTLHADLYTTSTRDCPHTWQKGDHQCMNALHFIYVPVNHPR